MGRIRLPSQAAAGRGYPWVDAGWESGLGRNRKRGRRHPASFPVMPASSLAWEALSSESAWRFGGSKSRGQQSYCQEQDFADKW